MHEDENSTQHQESDRDAAHLLTAVFLPLQLRDLPRSLQATPGVRVVVRAGQAFLLQEVEVGGCGRTGDAVAVGVGEGGGEGAVFGEGV